MPSSTTLKVKITIDLNDGDLYSLILRTPVRRRASTLLFLAKMSVGRNGEAVQPAEKGSDPSPANVDEKLPVKPAEKESNGHISSLFTDFEEDEDLASGDNSGDVETAHG